MKTLLVAILLFGVQSYAQVQSAYETLRNAYENASMPASIGAFDSKNWHGCAYVDVNNPTKTRETMVRILQYSQGGGHGPLFPGDSGYRIDVFQDQSLDRNLASFFQASRIQETGSYFLQSLEGQPWSRVNIYGRVDMNMLFFRVEVGDNNAGGYNGGYPGYNYGGYNGYNPGYPSPMNPRVYGYCWGQQQQPGPGDGNGDGEQPPPIPLPN